jgi:hypothetical protein
MHTHGVINLYPAGWSLAVLRRDISNCEADSSELFPTIIGYSIRTPRRHPDPVDTNIIDEL